MITHVIAEVGAGGAERVLGELIGHQQSRAPVSLIAGRGAGEHLVPAGSHRRLYIGERAALSRSPSAVLRLTRDITRGLTDLQPDLIHVHNVRVALAVRLSRQVRRARASRRPTIVSVQGIAPSDYRNTARILRGFDHVVSVSEAVRQDLLAAGLPADNVSVIPNAVPIQPPRTESQVEAARRTLGDDAGGSTRLLVAMGRMVPQKRHDLLLRAFKHVADGNTRLVILGDGPLRPDLEALVSELELQGSVSMPGYLREGRAALVAADLMLFSSEWEGLSLAALEALSFGLPIVSTRAHGMEELAKTGGALLTGDDPMELASTIREVLGDSRRMVQMAAAGRDAVADTYNAVRMNESYAELYRRFGASLDASANSA